MVNDRRDPDTCLWRSVVVFSPSPEEHPARASSINCGLKALGVKVLDDISVRLVQFQAAAGKLREFGKELFINFLEVETRLALHALS